ARARPAGPLGSGRLHVHPRLLRAQPDGGGVGHGTPRARARGGRGAPGRAAVPAARGLPGSLWCAVGRARRDRGRARGARPTVFFLFLAPLAVGLMAMLPFVPDRAGIGFFRLCSASAAVMTTAGLGLLLRRFGAHASRVAPGGEAYPILLAAC